MPGSITDKPIDRAGPLVTVRINVTAVYEQALIRNGAQVPSPREAQALLDTGSSMMVIDADIARVLALTPHGTRPVRSSLTGSQTQAAKVYEVSLSILVGLTVLHGWPKLPVLEGAFGVNDDYHVIIGRDLLDECVFTYNGKRQTFNLDI